jgi:hypothetical protein
MIDVVISIRKPVMSRLKFLFIAALCLFAQPALAHSVPSPTEVSEPFIVVQNTITFLLWSLMIGGAGFALFIWRDKSVSLRTLSAAILIGGTVFLLWTGINRVPVSSGDPLLFILNRTLHMLTSYLWTGGLIVLLVMLYREPQNRSQWMPYFAHYTRLCMAALALTGIYSAWQGVGSVEGLLTTAYGQALIVKTLLFAVILQLSLGKRLNTRMLLIQAGLFVIVLGATGVMRSVDTSRTILDWRIDQIIHETNTVVYDTVLAQNLQVDFTIIPGTAGENTAYVTMFDATNGLRLDNASTVNTLIAPIDASAPPVETALTGQGDGVYSAPLTLATGDWNGQVVVAFPDRGGVTTSYNFQIVPPLELPTQDPFAPRLQLIVALLIGLMLIMVGGLFVTQERGYSPQLLAWMFAVVGVIMTVATVRVWVMNFV